MKSKEEIISEYQRGLPSRLTATRVSVSSVDMPFGEMVKLAIKWTAAMGIASLLFGVPILVVLIALDAM